MAQDYDFIIIGGGVIGLSIARDLKTKRPQARVLIIEKEAEVAEHASGRNSGVLHAGFYYTADSFKARFTVAGNQALRAYCAQKGIAVNACGKLVVARDASELAPLEELYRRGQRNGANVALIDEPAARRLEPNVRTFEKALYSPDTASVDPRQVCLALKADLQAVGVDFRFSTRYLHGRKGAVATTAGDFTARQIINCAGLYADRVARDFGFGRRYTMIPFKGLYLKYTKNKTDIGMNIYPVPNLKNPFLGVHFTKTAAGDIKIGPTAIPAFWRENYGGWDNLKAGELGEILFHEARLFCLNAFKFRDLAFEEMRKYNKTRFVRLAQDLVQDIDPAGFTEFTRPGIRAQLLDKAASALVQDFVVEADRDSVHVLNAVSPAFTCSFPFAAFVTDSYILT